MIFFSTFANYMFRVNMSVSIIAMVRTTAHADVHPECLENATIKIRTNTGPRFAWSQTIQGMIIGGYFYGFILSSLLAGPICEYLGAWKSNLVASIAQALFNSLTPLGAKIHYGAAFGVRFIIGLTGGIAYPAMELLISKWAPPDEKGRFTSMLLGDTIGIVATLPIVAEVSEGVSWEWGFYVLSIIMLVYCVAFFFIVSDSPDKHWFISQEEVDFIEESHRGVVAHKKVIAPYKKIITSLAFWAVTIAEFGNLWGLYLIITGTPKFLVEVMGFNIRQMGVLAALPYLGRFCGGFIFGWIGDLLKEKTTLRTMNIRRIATIFSHFLPGIGIICITLAGCNAIIVIGLMISAMTVNGALIMGYMQSPQDLAPNFAATFYGWMMFFGGTTGFIVPALTGALIEKHNGLAQWHTIYTIGGTVYLFCGLWFMITGHGSLQKWNQVKEDEEVKPEAT